MKKFVLYGAGRTADYVRDIIEGGMGGQVVAFAVDSKYLKTGMESQDGVPLVPVETLPDRFPPSEYDVAIAFLGTDLYVAREKAFRQCLEWGYELSNVIHPKAIVEAEKMGRGNIVGPKAVIAPFCKIGDGNFIFELAHLAHHTHVGNFNTLSSAHSSNNVTIGNHCFLGINCTSLPHIKIADYTMVGAMAYVAKDTASFDVVADAAGIESITKNGTKLQKMEQEQN